METKINIGNLTTLINIYKDTTVKDNSGETIKTPVLYAKKWSEVKDKNANETEDGKIYLVQQRDYIIRFDEYIFQNGEEMYIIDVDGTFAIHGTQRIGRKDYLILNAVKRE